MAKSAISSKRLNSTNSWSSPLRMANFALLFSIVGILFLVFSRAATVAGYYGSVENHQVKRINEERAKVGKSDLQHIECLNALGELHAKEMADYGRIFHTDDTNRDGVLTQAEIDKHLLYDRVSYVCGNWTVVGENVSQGWDSEGVMTALMGSTAHRHNIVGTQKDYNGNPTEYTKVGVGAYYTTDGKLWVTQLFATCSKCTGNWNTNATVAVDPTATTGGSSYYLRNSNSSGGAEIFFGYGIASDMVLFCDWDGNGTDTVGVYRDTKFYLRNSNSEGGVDISFGYGGAGDIPICGDWNGDGKDTIGVFRPSNRNWYLRNSNSGGGVDISFGFGGDGDIPIVGDWNGDGKDTIGVFRPSNRYWYMRNSNSGGGTEISFGFGGDGDIPIVGDWNGDGIDTIGVFRPSNRNWYMRNSNSGGGVDISFGYGGDGDKPIVGDWDGNRTTTIGIIR